jgi:2'-5' RNA ligase
VTQPADRPRLFVAVELDGHVRQALDRLQHDLQRHRLAGLRWVRPEGIHLTLKFLGETPRDRVAEITGALAGCGKHPRTGCLSARLARSGARPARALG